MNDLLTYIDEIDVITESVEIDVISSLLDVYSKEAQMIQEGEKWDKVKQTAKDFIADSNAPLTGKEGESTLKKILMFIPRLIAKLIRMIHRAIKQISRRKNIFSDKLDKRFLRSKKFNSYQEARDYLTAKNLEYAGIIYNENDDNLFFKKNTERSFDYKVQYAILEYSNKQCEILPFCNMLMAYDTERGQVDPGVGEVIGSRLVNLCEKFNEFGDNLDVSTLKQHIIDFCKSLDQFEWDIYTINFSQLCRYDNFNASVDSIPQIVNYLDRIKSQFEFVRVNYNTGESEVELTKDLAKPAKTFVDVLTLDISNLVEMTKQADVLAEKIEEDLKPAESFKGKAKEIARDISNA